MPIEPTGPDEPAPQSFSGARLRRLREREGLTREMLAVAVGRSFGSINLYERGQVVPPTRVVGRLADALGCAPGDLFDGRALR